jgi:hypothetical protein
MTTESVIMKSKAKERLEAVIVDRLLDPGALADKARIHRAVMADLRAGRRRITELYDYRLSQALDLPPGYFLYGTERTP